MMDIEFKFDILPPCPKAKKYKKPYGLDDPRESIETPEPLRWYSIKNWMPSKKGWFLFWDSVNFKPDVGFWEPSQNPEMDNRYSKWAAIPPIMGNPWEGNRIIPVFTEKWQLCLLNELPERYIVAGLDLFGTSVEGLPEGVYWNDIVAWMNIAMKNGKEKA